jgi:chromosome segregation ATPase
MSAEVERLRTQHADAVWEKSAADSKCRKLADKVAALEGEKTNLRRQLAEERREANEALAKAQAALAEANLARVEGSLARERAEQLGERLSALQSRVERAEAATRTEAERSRKQLMDSFHELVRGPLTSKCRTESPDFAAWSGYRRSCRHSPLSWRGSCLMPPWSPARGDECALSRRVPAL